jgi:hypothetical protein
MKEIWREQLAAARHGQSTQSQRLVIMAGRSSGIPFVFRLVAVLCAAAAAAVSQELT